MNALQGETSPYLLQHVHNLVNWYPWGEEALTIARSENKPILLSIGYSACHWCHVMAHESFENEATADLMNCLFVNIKVDREERPDIDKIYQNAQFLLTQRNGGWPLTMFLTPDDQVPFFGGTYFPPEARHGLPAFSDLLQQVADFYRDRESDIRSQNIQVLEALRAIEDTIPVTSDTLNHLPITASYEQTARAYDDRLGGFGRAPKFPHPTGLERLLRDFRRDRASYSKAKEMVLFTLTRIAKGGIHDQLGGGFCRYSVDNQWLIPHFEKMLYDNGPLLSLYAHAWQIEQTPLFKQAADGIFSWCKREMTAPSGAFFSSLDADSEGTEGKFYVWDKAEIQQLLGDDFEIFARRYGLTRPANFEGQWNLHVFAEFSEIANAVGGEASDIERRVASAKNILFNAREKRTRPARDDKILPSWNALMIKGLAQAARIFERNDYLTLAEGAVRFIYEKMWDGDQLYATANGDKIHLSAYLDDYAFLIDALMELIASRWNADYLDFAITLTDTMLAKFEDRSRGGFFFTAHDQESLIHRTKSISDDALPSGNGVAAKVLGRLGHALGDIRYLQAAERTLTATWPVLCDSPNGHQALLLALEEFIEPPSIIVLRGDEPEVSAWKAQHDREFAPERIAFTIPTHVTELPGLLSQHSASEGVTAYVCHGNQCLPAIKSLEDFVATLRADPG